MVSSEALAAAGLGEAPRAPRIVLAGVAGEPSDDEVLDAGAALARALAGVLDLRHVEPDPDGVTHAERELARLAEALPAYVVVLGRRGVSPDYVRAHAWPGTTTRGLLAALHRPLWLQRGHWSPPERILAAIEDPERDRGVLELALEVAAGFHADVTALHCAEPGAAPASAAHGADEGSGFERWVARVTREHALDAGSPTPPEVRGARVAGPPIRALARHLERADLVVLGRGTRQGLGRVLHATLAMRRGPLLVVPGGP